MPKESKEDTGTVQDKVARVLFWSARLDRAIHQEGAFTARAMAELGVTRAIEAFTPSELKALGVDLGDLDRDFPKTLIPTITD